MREGGGGLSPLLHALLPRLARPNVFLSVDAAYAATVASGGGGPDSPHAGINDDVAAAMGPEGLKHTFSAPQIVPAPPADAAVAAPQASSPAGVARRPSQGDMARRPSQGNITRRLSSGGMEAGDESVTAVTTTGVDAGVIKEQRAQALRRHLSRAILAEPPPSP